MNSAICITFAECVENHIEINKLEKNVKIVNL